MPPEAEVARVRAVDGDEPGGDRLAEQRGAQEPVEDLGEERDELERDRRALRRHATRPDLASRRVDRAHELGDEGDELLGRGAGLFGAFSNFGAGRLAATIMTSCAPFQKVSRDDAQARPVLG